MQFTGPEIIKMVDRSLINNPFIVWPLHPFTWLLTLLSQYPGTTLLKVYNLLVKNRKTWRPYKHDWLHAHHNYIQGLTDDYFTIRIVKVKKVYLIFSFIKTESLWLFSSFQQSLENMKKCHTKSSLYAISRDIVVCLLQYTKINHLSTQEKRHC